MNKWLKSPLLVALASALGFFIVFAVAGRAEETLTSITFENCTPGTWVGGVKWEWKDGVKGNYQGSTYKEIPELELKGTGSLIIDLERGDYAITHYRPTYSGPDRSGQQIIFVPAAILEFREIEVSAFNATHSFGCEE